MVLRSRILPQSIKTDERVLAFSQQQVEDEDMLAELKTEQGYYVRNTLIQAFDLEKINRLFTDHEESVGTRLMPDESGPGEWAGEMLKKIRAQKDIAEKFTLQLSKLLDTENQEDQGLLVERSIAAVNYFNTQIAEWKKSIEDQVSFYKTKKKVKKYLLVLNDLTRMLQRKEKLLGQSLELTKGLAAGQDLEYLLKLAENQHKPVTLALVPEKAVITKTKSEIKEASSITTLKLFRAGVSIPDIAAQRGLVYGTIFSHLTEHLAEGAVDILDLVFPEKVNTILDALEKYTGPGLKPLKDQLGDSYSYDEIRAVSIFRKSIAGEKEAAKSGD
jgi:Helix-turn-helix domain